MFSNQKILFIGSVWPEPKSSAAGTRIMQLIHFFLNREAHITFCSAASNLEFSEDLNSIGVKTRSMQANDSSFDTFITELNPDIVIFDRFMTEEQFGWRVAEACPDTIRILDTEDLHFLRVARQKTVKQSREFSTEDLFVDEARREIASIYRCDCSLIISKHEMELLENTFNIDSNILLYLPFMEEEIQQSEQVKLPGFTERSDFITIGNFLHPPNWDAVVQLKEKTWPLIRKKLPEARMLIYGAYSSQKSQQLHNEKENFLVQGRAEDVIEVLQKARVLLAPLRFGAGLKGKLISGMKNGIPSVTTDIGAEGMNFSSWNGFIENDWETFAEKAVELYKNQTSWEECRDSGFEIHNALFKKSKHEERLSLKLEELSKNLENHRQRNFIGSMLLQNTMNSYKYMSKWIEEKNKK